MPSVPINGHDMYYEIHGSGDPAICMGGWGTYCHGGEGGGEGGGEAGLDNAIYSAAPNAQWADAWAVTDALLAEMQHMQRMYPGQQW